MSPDRYQPDPDLNNFEAYMTSMQSYRAFGDVPGLVWRRLHGTVDTRNDKTRLEACSRIATLFSVPVAQVQEILKRFPALPREQLKDLFESQTHRETRLTRNRLRVSLFPFNKANRDK